MAHGLEARVPFLELDMISLGLSLPAGWKLAGEGQEEKRLLRQAFEGWLPEHFLWRQEGPVRGRLRGRLGPQEAYGRERHRGGVQARAARGRASLAYPRGGRLLPHLRRRSRRG